MIISKILKTKFYCIDQNTTIFDAINMMNKNKDGFVIFTKNNKVTGILTERDLVSYIIKTQDYNKIAYDFATKNVITFKENRTIEYILMSLIEFEIRRVIVVDKNENFVGITTQEHLIGYIDTEAYKIKMKLSHITDLNEIITKDIATSINDTFKNMKANNVGSIIITEKNNPIGIITERDIVQVISKEINLDNSISTIMSEPIIYANIDSTIDETLKIMKQNGIQRIVIKDNDKYKLLGIRDILHIIKSNYSLLIEKKLKHAKTILNTIQEAIIEVCKIDNEYIIKWCNKKAFEIFGNNIIDKEITIALNSELWNNIINDSLKNKKTFEYKINIKKSFYKLTCICENLEDEDNLRLIFVDITQLEELNLNLKDKVEEKTKELQDINNNLEIKIKEAVEKNKQMLETLHKTEKMAALGEMIGNIAHQWRQPLSVISSAATGMELQKEYGILNDEVFFTSCESINKNAQYLSKIIDDFRDFIKGDSIKVFFDLKNDTDSFLQLVNTTINDYNIDVILDLKENIGIQGYPNELIKCFIQIFNNSKDALSNIKEDERYIFISQDVINDKIIIKFKDNAGGIPENILPKIFEPYFTTKHQSIGTGLGLTIAYSLIVGGMNGTIKANNTSYTYNGKKYTGAQFIITLPLLK